MLQAYADWFGAKSTETAMLNLLGLFDRPATLAALTMLVAEPVIEGLSDAFFEADAPPLTMVLKRLEKLKLITRPDGDAVDGHPLVREHFGARLQKINPEAWKHTHSRLFDYFCGIPDKDQPEGEAGLLPLYQSLPHGVDSGRAREALEEVFYRRINRSGQHYGTKQLGLYSTELAALATFFPGGWQQAPLQEVTNPYQSLLLNMVGYHLQSLGRLKEAQAPFERSVALWIRLENHGEAAVNNSNLSSLLLLLGELQAALERVSDAVDFADKTENNVRQAAFRGGQANVLAMQGKMHEAKILFEQAEHREAQEHPDFPYLYSFMSGSYYAAFLIHNEPPSTLLTLAERVWAAFQMSVNVKNLLDIGLCGLNLAGLAARLGEETAAAKFDGAIHALENAKTRQYYPMGYIARAGFRRAQSDLKGAWEDLERARLIAEPSGMRLYLCDALIEEAWLHHLEGNAEKAYKAYKEAKAEVDDMGYHWQDQALAELHQALA